MKSILLIISLIVGAFFLSGCIFGESDDHATNRIAAGAYHSDYGASGRSQGHESELVLDSNGDFHFFEMGDSTPWVITRGDWKSEDGVLILNSALRRNAHYSYVFDYWDTIPVDTSYLRRISTDGFERLELSRDSGFYFDVVRWVSYQRLESLPQLAAGHYECTETYSFTDDPAVHTGFAYLDLTLNGAYGDGRSEDGKPLWEFESSRWFQSGSFLIVKSGRGRNYDDSSGFTEWGPLSLDTNAEYVVRLRAIAADSFQQWVPLDQSSTGFPHWMTWRRKR